MTKAIHFTQYIQGRKNVALRFGPNKHGKIVNAIYCDANFGLDPYTCFLMSMGLGTYYFKSYPQKEKQLASTHTELRAASDACAAGMHVQHLMKSMNFPKESYEVILFYEDNKSVMALIRNGRAIDSKSKHIDIRYFWMKQYFDNGTFKMIHCPTNEMVADIGTKPKVGDAFLYNRARLLGYEYVYEG